MARPKKIKRLACPFGLKIGRVGRSIFFFLNLDVEEIQYYSCVCILGMQSFRISLILVLEGVVFHFIWLK